MQFVKVALLVALSWSGPCSVVATSSPVEKVVKLLVDMQHKIKADGASEKALYDKYSCWCTGMTSKKGKAIEEAKTELKKLGNEIISLRSKVAKFSSDINDAAKDMKENHELQQTATEAREKENAAFTATRAEVGQATQALSQALTMIKMAPQFLQTTQSLSTDAAKAVRSAIEAIPDRALGSVSAAKLAQLQLVGTAKYNPSYGSIVGILEEMYKTFSADLEKETQTEAAANSDFEKLMGIKVKELVTLQEKMDKKEEAKSDAGVDLADAMQNYDDTETQMNADVEFFNDAVTNCENKASNWETRQKMRAEELSGVEKAIEILSSDSSRALFANAINAENRVSLLQRDVTPSQMPVGQQQAFKVLKSFATKSQSVVLAKIAAQVQLAKGGHFEEVMGSIDKVVRVLKDEQQDDNKKKEQCNDEYQKVAKTSADLEWQIEKNEAKVAKLDDTIASRLQQKAATIASIKDVKQDIEDMNKERKAAQESHEAGKTDDENAIDLLKQAKDALQEFYEKHKLDGALAAFIQGKPDDVLRGDAAPNAKFSGKGSRSIQTKGISQLLQTIIEGLEDEISVQTKVEKEAIAAYNKAKEAAEGLQKSLELKKTNLEKEIADRSKDKDDENKSKQSNEEDHKDEQDYKAKIKPDCDFMLKNWQGRFDSRKTEMDGLVQAKDFLAGAMQKSSAALAQTKGLKPISSHLRDPKH